MKEFYLDPKDLVQNSSGQINRRKGGRRALCQAVYEYGEGPFELKYDRRIGIRSNVNVKDKKRGPFNGITKGNHFWWLISKAYLNLYHLKDAQDCFNSFVNGTELKKKVIKEEEDDEEVKEEDMDEDEEKKDEDKEEEIDKDMEEEINKEVEKEDENKEEISEKEELLDISKHLFLFKSDCHNLENLK